MSCAPPPLLRANRKTATRRSARKCFVSVLRCIMRGDGGDVCDEIDSDIVHMFDRTSLLELPFFKFLS